MNELENTLNTILLKAIEVAEQTGEFIIDEGSVLLKQFYLWHTSMHIMGMVLAIIIFIVGIVIAYSATRKSNDLLDHPNDGYKVLFTRWVESESASNAIFWAGLLTSCSFIVLFCVQVYKLVFILIAPRLYLIDYFIINK